MGATVGRAGSRRHLRSARDPAVTAASIPARGRFRFAAKRAFDLLVGGLVLLVMFPVFAVIALWLLVSNGRPVFYRQTRVGRYGVPFTMFKFRSMVPDAHEQRDDLREHNQRTGPLFKMHEDPRVTRAGRFLRATSLDEVPQLFNVLGGSMSLVGPRPALFEERESFPPELLAREQMRPGLTGLWQVKARRDPDFAKYHDLDLEYVRRWTLWFDLRLLVLTPFAIARELFHAWRASGVAVEPIAPRVGVEEPARAQPQR